MPLRACSTPSALWKRGSFHIPGFPRGAIQVDLPSGGSGIWSEFKNAASRISFLHIIFPDNHHQKTEQAPWVTGFYKKSRLDLKRHSKPVPPNPEHSISVAGGVQSQ
jgi:hypothetical protein